MTQQHHLLELRQVTPNRQKVIPKDGLVKTRQQQSVVGELRSNTLTPTRDLGEPFSGRSSDGAKNFFGRQNTAENIRFRRFKNAKKSSTAKTPFDEFSAKIDNNGLVTVKRPKSSLKPRPRKTKGRDLSKLAGASAGILAGGLAESIFLKQRKKKAIEKTVSSQIISTRQRPETRTQLATFLKPLQESRQGSKQDQKFAFSGDFPRPSRDGQAGDGVFDSDIPRLNLLRFEGRGGSSLPIFQDFLYPQSGGGGSGNDDNSDRQFFRVFDVGVNQKTGRPEPFGQVQVGLGFIEDSPIPNFEIQSNRFRKGKRKGQRRRTPLQERFFNVNPLNDFLTF